MNPVNKNENYSFAGMKVDENIIKIRRIKIWVILK